MHIENLALDGNDKLEWFTVRKQERNKRTWMKNRWKEENDSWLTIELEMLEMHVHSSFDWIVWSWEKWVSK